MEERNPCQRLCDRACAASETNEGLSGRIAQTQENLMLSNLDFSLLSPSAL